MFQYRRGLPGPVDSSLLKLQNEHRSQNLWNGSMDDSENLTIVSPERYWTNVARHCHVRVMEILHRIGLYGVFRTGHIEHDHGLLTALVERWRRETHTFHFTFGETSITLEDVSAIYHLPTAGLPVIANTNDSGGQTYWIEKARGLLGINLIQSDIRNCNIRISTLRRHLISEENIITDDSTLEQVEMWARGFALLILAGSVIPFTSESLMPLRMLDFLVDLSGEVKYSWGSACLANLYHNLCLAVSPTKLRLYGPMTLLQIWAWSRLTMISPKLTMPPMERLLPVEMYDGENNLIGVLPEAPYGAKWTWSGHDQRHTVKHSVRGFRELFDSEVQGQFIWQPYTQDVYNSIPEEQCPSELFRYKGPLIYFNCVEFHRIDRVKRQLGMHQDIPENPLELEDRLHQYQSLTGRRWVELFRRYIDQWNNRTPLIGDEPGEIHIPHINEYLEWYANITRLFISNPERQSQPSDGVPTGQAAWRHFTLSQLERFTETDDRSLIDNLIHFAHDPHNQTDPGPSSTSHTYSQHTHTHHPCTSHVTPLATDDVDPSGHTYSPSSSYVPRQYFTNISGSSPTFPYNTGPSSVPSPPYQQLHEMTYHSPIPFDIDTPNVEQVHEYGHGHNNDDNLVDVNVHSNFPVVHNERMQLRLPDERRAPVCGTGGCLRAPGHVHGQGGEEEHRRERGQRHRQGQRRRQ